LKIYKTALVCLMTCAVAFFGCSCSLLEDDNNESSVSVTTSEKSSTSVKTTSKPKPTEPCVYNEPKTDYAYSTLTDDYVKKLYNQISDNIDSEYEPSFYAEGNLSEYQMTQAVEAYKNDHPEVFWLKSYYEYENYDYETGIWLTYTMSGDKLVTAKKEFNTAVDTISQSVPYGTECEREEYIHNYIINNCDYDEEAAESEEVQGNENDAYGVFVDGKAVCEGYSKAFQILCNKADIDCIQLMGIVDSDNHVWNCVKIGGDWYQIDVTWDDVDDFIYDSHEYFNLTDSLMYEEHTLSPKYSEIDAESFLNLESWCNFYVPKCTAEKYNYHNYCYNYKYPTVSNLDDSDNVSTAIAKAAKNGEEYFVVIVDENVNYDDVYDEVRNGYMYDWLTKANQINSDSPKLNDTCNMLYDEKSNLITFQLEYIN
jgi:transglutaminase/protease-like cytokinesis protein 3